MLSIFTFHVHVIPISGLTSPWRSESKAVGYAFLDVRPLRPFAFISAAVCPYRVCLYKNPQFLEVSFLHQTNQYFQIPILRAPSF